METNEKLLEGKKTDNLDATSASEEIVKDEEKVVEQPNEVPELNSTPIPTEEEKKVADIAEPNLEEQTAQVETTEPISDAVVEDEKSSEIVESENVEQQPQMREELGAIETPALKFSQNDMDNLAGKVRMETREKTFRYIYDRYGVASEEELDNLIGNAQRYDSLQDKYQSEEKAWKEQSSARDKELADVKEQVALMQSGIDSERYEDAKLILKGKGLEVNLENIQSELSTHPEWKKVEQPQENPNFAKVGEPIQPTSAEPVSKISVLGNEKTKNVGNSEEDAAMRFFKI